MTIEDIQLSRLQIPLAKPYKLAFGDVAHFDTFLVRVVVDGRPGMGEATDDDFGREFLALKMSVAVVPDLEAAVAHVNRFGTGHTEAIVTQDVAAARRFVGAVDAGTVTVNASTRFTDGEEFGFGAEIGISTQKLHARGPMGLPELTTTKFVVTGTGQTRG